jgi:hypothetical protein
LLVPSDSKTEDTFAKSAVRSDTVMAQLTAAAQAKARAWAFVGQKGIRLVSPAK